jgi:hypothetical protein
MDLIVPKWSVVLIYLAFAVLALLPLILTMVLRGHFVRYKQRSISDDLSKLRATESNLVKSWGGTDGVNKEIESYYSRVSLWVPSGLLSLFYLVLFALTYGHVARVFFGNPTWFFPANAAFTVPLVTTFLGAYLFNLGMIVRRLYVYDLNDNLFWGAINRLLLSLGLAIAGNLAFMPADGKVRDTLVLYFAIPFMLNKVLYAFLRAAGTQLGVLLHITTEAPAGSGLQQVSGINIWKEYRLEEEGIEEIENLATADVIELAVRTHFNVRTLIDWIDQAIVICRFGDKTEKMRAAGVNISAVELANEAPENNKAGSPYVTKLATALQMDVDVLTAQLNAMYEDEFIQTLWSLWQTRAETPLGAQAMSA